MPLETLPSASPRGVARRLASRQSWRWEYQTSDLQPNNLQRQTGPLGPRSRSKSCNTEPRCVRLSHNPVPESNGRQTHACPLETGGESASPRPRESPCGNHSVLSTENGKTNTGTGATIRCLLHMVQPCLVFGEKYMHQFCPL